MIAAVGCGGGGGGDSTPLIGGTNNQYAGDWQGNWITSSGQGGMVTLSISSSGTLTGTMFNTTFNSAAPMTGTVDGSGNFSATYQYPNNPVGTFNGTLLPTATMANSILCQYNGAIGSQTYAGSSMLTNKNITTTNPYTGVWSGPFQLSDGETGTISFSINTSGSIAGSVHNSTTGNNGTVNGNIDNGGTFYGTHQYSGQQTGIIVGTFTSTGNNTVQCRFSNALGNAVLSGNSNLTKQ